MVMKILRKEITPHGLDGLFLILAGWTLMDLAAVPFHPYASPNANLALKALIGVLAYTCFITAVVQWMRRNRHTDETDSGPAEHG